MTTAPLTSEERAALEAELTALRAAKTHVPTVIVRWIDVPPVDRDASLRVLPEHFRWLLAHEERGVLFGSGRLLDATESDEAVGMTILRCASLAEAEAIARTEPYVARGMRRFMLRQWDLNEGSITLRVRLGVSAFELPSEGARER